MKGCMDRIAAAQVVPSRGLKAQHPNPSSLSDGYRSNASQVMMSYV